MNLWEKIDANKDEHINRPFWSWNDELEPEELCRQIDAMKGAGIGGFFMHARTGLRTPYMGEKWMACIKACVEKAKQVGMQAWLYDENGWPSGFGDSRVTALGEAYQQKFLDCGETPVDGAHVLGYYRREKTGFRRVERPEDAAFAVWYTVNPYYIDAFGGPAVKTFLALVHETYKRELGSDLGNAAPGFFTDEPQYGNGHAMPWSTVFPDAFFARYGYDITDGLPFLFHDGDGDAAFRFDFFSLIGDLFRRNFMKQMYDWCEANGCQLTGHMMHEDTLAAQIGATGGVMACYPYFHVPGIDYLGRSIASPVLPLQVSSVAAQIGRPTITESFALCGWDVSLRDLKWILEWQYVNGVGSLCQHLEGYSLRGVRKRDYPASLFVQEPWFDEAYETFNRYATALGGLLALGEQVVPTLCLHPIYSAYGSFNFHDRTAILEKSREFDRFAQALADRHLPYHFGDEKLMAEMARVEDKQLVVGRCRYDAVIVPPFDSLLDTTVALLLEFQAAGGKVVFVDRLPTRVNGRPDDRLISLSMTAVSLDEAVAQLYSVSLTEDGKDAAGVHLQMRRIDGRTLYYIVNLTERPRTVRLAGVSGAAALDLLNCTETPLPASDDGITLALAPQESRLLLTGASAAVVTNQRILPLPRQWQVASATENALTLDFCEYAIDDGDWQPKIAVILLQQKLLEMQKDCRVKMRFTFDADDSAPLAGLALAMENPEQFTMTLNGAPFTFTDTGYYCDSSFRRSPLAAVPGRNELILETDFHQDPHVYYVLFTPGVSETEHHKLFFDTELESLYLLGSFGVTTDEPFTRGERRCLYAGERFRLTAPETMVDITDITPQKFWFFSGKITLETPLTVTKKPGERLLFSLDRLHAPAAHLLVNGQDAGILAFTPFVKDITDLLHDGDNTVSLRLLSGNRNLLGPHHRTIGETYAVTPAAFSDKSSWAGSYGAWTDRYHFVMFGAEPTVIA